MFPINIGSKVSLSQRRDRAASREERAQKKLKGELTHGNKQISNCYMYHYIGIETNK